MTDSLAASHIDRAEQALDDLTDGGRRRDLAPADQVIAITQALLAISRTLDEQLTLVRETIETEAAETRRTLDQLTAVIPPRRRGRPPWRRRAGRAAAAAVAAAVCLTGCGQFGGLPAPPPPRPTLPVGAAWAPAVTWLRAKPVKAATGMQVGILVRSHRPSDLGASINGDAWSGTVIVLIGGTGRAEDVSSDAGAYGMASFAEPGDEIEFPAANVPVDAPGDGLSSQPARVIVPGAVAIP